MAPSECLVLEPRGRLPGLVLRPQEPGPGEGAGQEQGDEACGQRTVTGMTTSALPRRHQDSRVEQ